MGDVNMNSTLINSLRPKQVNQQVNQPQYDPRCDLLKAIRDGWYYVIIQIENKIAPLLDLVKFSLIKN